MYTYTNRVKHFVFIIENLQFPFFLFGKDSACNVEDLGSIPGLGRSPGEGDGYLLQYSGLENSMDYSPWGGRVRHDWVTFTFTSGKHEMVSSPKQVIEKCAHNECERREVCDHCREKASKCLQLWLDQVEYEGGNHTVLIKKCWQHLGGIQLSPSSSLVWQSSIHSKPMK